MRKAGNNMSNNRTENTNKKRIALDIFVVLVVAVSLVGIILRCVLYSVDGESGNGKAEYYLAVRISDEYQTVAESLKPGDKVFLSSNGKMIGKIMRSDEQEETTTPDDVKPSSQIPVKTDSVVNVLLTEGKTVEGSYLVGNREYLTPGDTVKLYTAGTVFTAYIEQIVKLPDTYQ